METQQTVNRFKMTLLVTKVMYKLMSKSRTVTMVTAVATSIHLLFILQPEINSFCLNKMNICAEVFKNTSSSEVKTAEALTVYFNVTPPPPLLTL